MNTNGVLDEGGSHLPEAKVGPELLKEEKRLLKFVKSKEFKTLKEHFEARIKFYQQYLPDGRAITEASEEERGGLWVVANAIIGELENVIQSYEIAAESVKESINESRRV